ncbi:MAG: GatB/YqeY domain-containing protein [Bryobacteraceae bacterium]
MALLETIEQHMREAMKARDEARLSALRMIKSALTKHRADTARPLDEKAELQVLNMLIKQRKEAAEMFRKGGREDLAQKEEAELRLIESYMPAAASEEEMDAAVEAALAETGATSLKQMGAVMKAAQARLAGKRVDNKILSDKVRARLSG